MRTSTTGPEEDSIFVAVEEDVGKKLSFEYRETFSNTHGFYIFNFFFFCFSEFIIFPKIL